MVLMYIFGFLCGSLPRSFIWVLIFLSVGDKINSDFFGGVGGKVGECRFYKDNKERVQKISSVLNKRKVICIISRSFGATNKNLKKSLEEAFLFKTQ